jgi:hypothetical protein
MPVPTPGPARALARRPLLAAALLLAGLALLAGPVASRAAAALQVTPKPGLITSVVAGKPDTFTYTLTNDGPLPEALSTGTPHNYPQTDDALYSTPTFNPSNCPSVLAAGASCTVTITSAPQRLGHAEAGWAISLGAETLDFRLREDGVAPQATWDEKASQFGPVSADASLTKSIELRNTSPSEIMVHQFFLEGDTQSYSLLGDDCAGHWLRVHGTCTARVRFQPRGLGDFHARLVTSVPGGYHHPEFHFDRGLSGSGHHPKLEVTPGALHFGSTAVGTAHQSHAVTVKNVGLVPAHVETVLAGQAHGFRLAPGGCEAVLPAGGSCRIDVAFAPAEPETYRARLLVLPRGGGDWTTISLEGTGAPR